MDACGSDCEFLALTDCLLEAEDIASDVLSEPWLLDEHRKQFNHLSFLVDGGCLMAGRSQHSAHELIHNH